MIPVLCSKCGKVMVYPTMTFPVCKRCFIKEHLKIKDKGKD